MTTLASTVIIVASDAPGVDEGLVAAVIGRRRAGPKAAVLPVLGVRSRFAALCSGVIDFRADGVDIFTWDDTFDVIRAGGSTLCVEGGSATAFLDWCAETRIAEAVGDVEAVLVVPVTRAASAVAGATRTIKAARRGAARRGLSFARVVLVLNARLGDPRVLAEDGGLVWPNVDRIVQMNAPPRLVAELEASGRRLDAVDRFVAVTGVGAEVGAMFGWDKYYGGQEMLRYGDWLQLCEDRFEFVGEFW